MAERSDDAVLMLPWRKFIAASIAAAFFGVLATSAMADCAADIAKIEPDLTKVVDATKKAAVEKQLNKAKHAVTQKNEKKCSKHLASAKKAAGIN
jgi:hypothetical protein